MELVHELSRDVLGRKEAIEQTFQTEERWLSMVRAEGEWGEVAGSPLENGGPRTREPGGR